MKLPVSLSAFSVGLAWLRSASRLTAEVGATLLAEKVLPVGSALVTNAAVCRPLKSSD